MPVIIQSGKNKGKSVEQLAVNNYSRFLELYDFLQEKNADSKLFKRMNKVKNIANDFISIKPCSQCNEPAKYISIWQTPSFRPVKRKYSGQIEDVAYISRTSSPEFIYCSEEHFEADSKVGYKGVLTPLTFDNMKSELVSETNALVRIVAECMGIKKGMKKEELENIFNSINTYSKQFERDKRLYENKTKDDARISDQLDLF